MLCISGYGFYQEWGKPVTRLQPGDCINISAGVKHWHDATPNSWFSHLAVEVPGIDSTIEWLETVAEEVYVALG